MLRDGLILGTTGPGLLLCILLTCVEQGSRQQALCASSSFGSLPFSTGP